MALHRMNSVTIGVPKVAETSAYYADFGLARESDGWFATEDGGRQLRVVSAPRRQLVEINIGAGDRDDIARIDRQLAGLDIATQMSEGRVTAVEPITGVRVVVEVSDPLTQTAIAAPAYNSPGMAARGTSRAPGILRETPVAPRKLGHVVFGSPDHESTQRFLTEGIGLKTSDTVAGLASFLRCSTDHHNVLVHNAPVTFLHHTSWQVEDVDEIGRGATRMLEGHPERHVWGLGRHHIASNFFWYLKDPAGNFSEYYSDMDCVIDDQLWKPGVWGEAHGLYNWGPPPPPSFVHPEDLAGLMSGAHQKL
ncbi:dioxygenase [Streptomyces libani subsp. rufus]|nr:dioxygenase [Streptomyces libani subsp. rufus]